MGYKLSYRLYIEKSVHPSHEALLYTLNVVPYYVPFSRHLTIYSPTETHNPRPLLYTLYVVPYYGSLLSVYIGIEKWVINWVMGYKLGNGGTHNPRPLLYTLNVVPQCVSFTETLTIYPQRGSSMCILHRDPYYIPSTWYPYYILTNPRPQPETLPIYPVASPHQGFTIRVSISIEKWVINSVIGYILRNRYTLHTRPPPETLTIYPLHGSLLWFLVKCVPFSRDPNCIPSIQSLTMYPQSSPVLCTLNPVPYCIPSTRDPYYIPSSP